MLINISLMKGEVPRLKSHLLPDEAATLAQDCQFESGIVGPLKADKLDQALPMSPKALFKYDDVNWFAWSERVSAIHNPMAQDEWQRVYWTGQGKPKVTAQDIAIGAVSPAAWYDLGVPRPASAPIVTNINDSTGEEPPEGEAAIFDDESRVYIQTFVSRFGEEGAPGDPSVEATILKPGSTVTISLATIGANTHNITHTRLYRSVTSNGVADYMLVAEVPIAQTQYVDAAKTLNSALLETWDYQVPDENMQGLCQMANGICAGFAGNEVMFSEAYLPYAWPEGYRGTTEHEIVGLAPIGTSLVVVTKGYPYIFSGVTPSAVNGTKLNVEQSCVSADSIAVINGVAMYASPDGLVAVGSDGGQLVTNPLITRDQWQQYNPSTIKAWSVEGQYIALYQGGGFIFDPVSQAFTQISNTWDCAFNDLEKDELFVAKGNQLYAWKGDSANISHTWQSKVFLMPVDALLSCARIQSPNPELLSMTLYVDNEDPFVMNIGEIDNQAFRLPAVRGTKWQVKVSGNAEVERILIASSMQELS